MPAAGTVEEKTMDVLYERVAGLDVHKDTVVACVRIMAAGKTTRECRTFATTTGQLEELRTWLEECRCTHVAMEATGVYWMPVFRILDAGKFELIVANAAHIKNVPGRKTDMNDAMWIADLLACGLIKASFVPHEEMQELRALTRTRKQLVREQTRHVQRIEKTLAEANIKLSSVLSDIMGASGRRIIQAMIDGVRQPDKLAKLAGKQIKATPKELYDALHGRLTDHHGFLLALHLKQWDGIDETIRKLDLEIDQRIGRMETESNRTPFRTLIGLLTTIPGVSAVASPAILSEIGPDMSRFPTAGHLVAWAGLCPGHNESAGKRKSSRLRNGAPWRSRPCSCNAPGLPSARKTATIEPNSSACKPSAGRKKPFAPSPPRSSPPSTTSSRMAPNTTTSVLLTSIGGPRRSKRAGWLHASKSSASLCNYSQ
jgi:transposase